MEKREIKFRGKRIDNGEWVYGLVYYYSCRGEILTMIQNGEYAVKNGSIYGHEVEAESVGQYTGLKDKNGKEIYEGDVVLTQEYSDRPHSGLAKRKRHTGVVEYLIGESTGFFNALSKNFDKHIQYSAKWSIKIKEYGKYKCSNWGPFYDCEVMGKIYENPELSDTTRPDQ